MLFFLIYFAQPSWDGFSLALCWRGHSAPSSACEAWASARLVRPNRRNLSGFHQGAGPHGQLLLSCWPRWPRGRTPPPTPHLHAGCTCPASRLQPGVTYSQEPRPGLRWDAELAALQSVPLCERLWRPRRFQSRRAWPLARKPYAVLVCFSPSSGPARGHKPAVQQAHLHAAVYVQSVISKAWLVVLTA